MKPRTRLASLAPFAPLASIILLPAGASAQIGSSPFAIGLEPVTSVAGPPLDLTHAGDGTNRLFLAGQNTGDVHLFKNNTLLATPFLDINGVSGATAANVPITTGGERGLLGMAFHPNFAAPSATPGSGKFYTYTSEPKAATFANVDFIHDENDGTDTLPGNGGDHDSVIREWTVSAADPDRIDVAAGSRVIMRIRQPQQNHNGGAMRFGPDGYLYVALGDGGGSNDNSGGFTSPSDGHTNNTGNAQDINNYALPRNLNVLGKILRIDPRAPGTTPGSSDPQSFNGRYRIPADNPLVGPTAGADEIFAYGLRNPFRMSFDRLNGTLYAGDVGQGQREEVDIITKGGNFGWVYWEGTRVNVAEPAGLADIKPIGEYTHADGQAVIGGFVYRGSNIPELYGKYVFGELGWNDPDTVETTVVGRLFHMEPTGGAISEFQYLLNSAYDSMFPVIAPNAQLYALGEDRDGELYAMFADGNVRRILGRQWYAQTGGSWGIAANWLGAMPNSAGAAANFLGRVSSAASTPAIINLDGARTVGSMLFNNNVAGAGVGYRIAPGNGGTLTINNGAGVASVKVVKGNHEITAPVSVASNAELDISDQGTLSATATVSVVASRTLTKKGAGTATLRGVAMQSSSTLAVTDGTLALRNVTGGTISVSNGRLNISPNGGPPGTSKVNAVNVTNAGRLDLANNKLIVIGGDVGTFNGSTYSGLTGRIAAAYNFSNWDGPGITTGMPDAGPTVGLTTVAINTADETFYAGGTFGGVSVSSGDVLLMYTYAGDVNLDGLVDAADYGVIDNWIQFPGTSGYMNGDFNYDGVIDAADYGIIDNTIQLQGPPIPINSVAAAGEVSLVPEPGGALAVMALASLCFVCPRRRARQ